MRSLVRTSVVSVGVSLGALGATLALVTPAAQAQHGSPDIPPHRHFLVTPDGARHPVGPQVCGRPELQYAFNQFHLNVHVGTPGTGALSQPHNLAGVTATPC